LKQLCEAINVFLSHVKKNGHTMNLYTGTTFLGNINIKEHVYSDNPPNLLSIDIGFVCDKLSEGFGNYLIVSLEQTGLVWVDVRNISQIRFDAIVSSPKNGEEMEECLEHLKDLEPYNIYLWDSEENDVLSLCRVIQKK